MSEQDCFMVSSGIKQKLSFPVHVHSEIELNFIENGAGVKRIVGDSVEIIGDEELTLIAGSNLEHGWFGYACAPNTMREISILFPRDLLSPELLRRNQFHSVKDMLDRAAYGITFPKETVCQVKEQIYSLATGVKGAHSVLKLMGLLLDLSQSKSIKELSSRSFDDYTDNQHGNRIEKVYSYMRDNYEYDVRLSDVASLIGMSDVAFSRFIKQRTGRNFIDSLNDIRLNHASRMLVDSRHSIAEIAFRCGFTNLSNFNRIFKKKKSCTPSEFRENYRKSKFFV